MEADPDTHALGNAMPALFAYLHHLAAFSIVASLIAEHILLTEPLSPSLARKILTLDLIYGIAAGLLLSVGLLRVFFFEKGAAYYFHSAPFLLKMLLFLTVGLASIIPTMEFLSWRKALAQGKTPVLSPDKKRRLMNCLRLELLCVCLIPLCAALMAKGVGFFG